jgi:hypothetical protein
VIAHMATVLAVERSIAMDPHFLERVFGGVRATPLLPWG